MRKIFLLGSVLMIVISLFGFSVFPVSAAPSGFTSPPPTPATKLLPPVLVLESRYFAGLPSGQHIPAQMYIDSNFQNIYCVVINISGEVQCQFPRKYAKHAAILHLEVGGQTLIFWVTIPREREAEQAPIIFFY